MRFPEIASPLVALVALAFAASTVGCAAQADPAQEASGENVRATAASLEGTTTIRVLEANLSSGDVRVLAAELVEGLEALDSEESRALACVKR